MQLLDPTQVKQEKDRSEDERRVRMEKLRVEESSLINSLNIAREDVEKRKREVSEERGQIDSSLEIYRRSAEKKKRELSSEIASLEAQRAEDLKPINEIRQEAEKRLTAAQEQETQNER